MKKVLFCTVLILAVFAVSAGGFDFNAVSFNVCCEDLTYFETKSCMLDFGLDLRLGKMVNEHVPVYAALNVYYSANYKNAQYFSQIPSSAIGCLSLGSGYVFSKYALLGQIGLKLMNFGFEKINLFSLAEIKLIPSYFTKDFVFGVPVAYSFGKNGNSLCVGISAGVSFGGSK